VNDIVLLKQALPYLRHHKKSTMVVKLGGEIAANPQALRSLAEDVSLLTHVGIRLVVVHGGGPQATEMQRRLGLEPVVVGGRRVTDEATLDVAKMVFAGKINTDILSALRGQGVSAVGLSGVDGDILHAVKRPPTEVVDPATGEKRVVDYGHVGDVTRVDTSLLRLLLENKYVPVISSLASDGDGNILNVNADTVASVIAKDLAASKLVILTGVPGLLRDRDDPASLVSRITTDEARAAMRDGSVSGGMLPKLKALVEAVEGGVERGHVLSGTLPGALLLELFTSKGSGTLIAEPGDVSEIVDGGPRG
jgi:acetylglutamate kinase